MCRLIPINFEEDDDDDNEEDDGDGGGGGDAQRCQCERDTNVSQSKWREKFDGRRERVFNSSRVINSTSFIIREWR